MTFGKSREVRREDGRREIEEKEGGEGEGGEGGGHGGRRSRGPRDINVHHMQGAKLIQIWNM